MTMVSEQSLLFTHPSGQATLGFTGTQRGMTHAQMDGVMYFLGAHTYKIARHGDCIGADAEFDEYASIAGLTIHIHPCNITEKRAWTKNFWVEHPVRAPLDRNKDIVRMSDFLLATPGEMQEELRSGTWATVRFARKVNKPLRIIYPNGSFGE